MKLLNTVMSSVVVAILAFAPVTYAAKPDGVGGGKPDAGTNPGNGGGNPNPGTPPDKGNGNQNPGTPPDNGGGNPNPGTPPSPN